MVIARDDGAGHLQEGGAVAAGWARLKDALMFDLAEIVCEAVQATSKRKNKAGFDSEPEDGPAYIREVVDEANWNFLVVAPTMFGRWKS